LLNWDKLPFHDRTVETRSENEKEGAGDHLAIHPKPSFPSCSSCTSWFKLLKLLLPGKIIYNPFAAGPVSFPGFHFRGEENSPAMLTFVPGKTFWQNFSKGALKLNISLFSLYLHFPCHL
jgi:hypothetical protein